MISYSDRHADNIKIAYIGGGSRGWGWSLMRDLGCVEDMRGEVYLYDIDYDAAYRNAVIGNRVGAGWKYTAVRTIGEALCGADFVIISILPGTFREMESDVHAPEKYGIYQSVGDTTGPGGMIRAIRTIPMIEEIARAVEKYSPDAWVINYTNPLAVCVSTLYRIFPRIKAFGCCHEVFGTQKLLAEALDIMTGAANVGRDEIKINVLGLNHFTWITDARYRNTDLFPMYREFTERYYETGYEKDGTDGWMNDSFKCANRVKFDLFRRFGYIAAAGDRHLAEFMDTSDYLENPERVKEWKFGLTPVSWRRDDLEKRLAKSQRLFEGRETLKIHPTGEEGTRQIRALIGLDELITNVNLPNVGQIPNLPEGVVVETNACFRAGSLTPVLAGNIPDSINPYVSSAAAEQAAIVDAGINRDMKLARETFVNGRRLKDIPRYDAERLFDEMTGNTKEYLKEYR